MALSVFDDKANPPTEDDLARELGSAFAIWQKLERAIAKKHGPITAEWKFATKSTGWGMRLKKGDRIVLYMTPCQGYFLAALVLGDRAVEAARSSDLPEHVVSAINSAKRYVEGTGVRFEIRKTTDLASIEKLAAIKMAK